MVINVYFQNLGQANAEILKAFNSSTSAKALEAYQPLSPKERKLQKLRALQILKESSDSQSLADINLNTNSLALALKSAEGATLQAMLNLLSAKMIEQNKYSYNSEQEEIKKKIQNKIQETRDKEKQEKNQQEEEKNKKEKSKTSVDILLEDILNYFDDLQESILDSYKDFVSYFSLDNLRKSLKEVRKMILKYAYEIPLESLREFFVEPINNFAQNIKSQMGLVKQNTRAFSSKEIKTLLQKSLDSKLDSSVASLRKQMILKKSQNSIKMSAKDIKIALHR